jgi:hypothetical protein
MLHRPVGLGRGNPEELQGLVLGCSREREVGSVGQEPSAFDDLVDLVFEGVLIIFVLFRFSQSLGTAPLVLPP